MFKFNPNAASEAKYLKRAGVFPATIKSAECRIKGDRANFVSEVILVTDEGETTSKDVYKDPDSKGRHTILEQFVAATCTDEEAKKYIARGEFAPDEDFLRTVAQRATGRRVMIDVREEKFISKQDGQEKTAYKVAFFRRHKDGPELPY